MVTAGPSDHMHTNRLAKEESPYLLQHQHNPVDWYPWSTEAFDKAMQEDKPIFLSVGYSTCHWCHVMERESFEDDATAELLNESFVSIKVDREERPDVDKVYMTYVQATQGGGGWPMSCFLTPDLKPFLGGTYFPPQDAYGRPGFKTVLKRIAEVWKQKKDDIKLQSADSMQQLVDMTITKGGQQSLSDSQAETAMDSCTQMLAARYDHKLGGFGNAPKFPRPSELNLLLVHHIRAAASGSKAEANQALEMAKFTLQQMAAGGMYDQVGGGFHRYSVDEHWHIPHFEKMLYDNPQLASTYLDAFALTGDWAFAGVARGILDYLRRDMTHPKGGIFSAEDADSLDKAGTKKEGAFYMWPLQEIREVLGDAAPLFISHYYVKDQGNADLNPRSDPHGEFGGLNCLRQAQTLQETAKQAGVSEEEAQQTLAACREKLHTRRGQRPRPHLDDKIVAGWNGMAIQALASASAILQQEDPPQAPAFPVEGCPPSTYLQAAIKAAEFVQQHLWDEATGRLNRSFCRNPSAVQGFADDYSYLIGGLLELYQVTGETKWLQWCQKLQTTLDELFWDQTAGGYFSAAGDDPSILMRAKEDYDGAEPAASSIAAANLFKLAALVSGEAGQRYREQAVKTAAGFVERLQEMALAMPQMCCALYLQALPHARQVIISGAPDAPETQALLAAAHGSFAPDRLVLPIDPANQASKVWYQQHNPEAWAMIEGATKEAGAAARAFVCQNFTCRAPTTDPQVLSQLMNEPVSTAPSKTTLTELNPVKLTRAPVPRHCRSVCAVAPRHR